MPTKFVCTVRINHSQQANNTHARIAIQSQASDCTNRRACCCTNTGNDEHFNAREGHAIDSGFRHTKNTGEESRQRDIFELLVFGLKADSKYNTCLGKDKKLKDIALPAFFSGIFGVTEPAIYGVTLPRIKMFVIACIGAAAGSAVGAITGLTLYSYAGMGVIGLLGMINPNGATNFVGIILMVAVAFGFSFVMAWFTYKDEDGTSENILTEQGEKNQKKSAPRTEKSAMALQKVEIAAPLSGTVKPLGECSDEAFSTEVLGKGVVILPENGIVMAPFDGVVENLFSTRHAIALTDKTGCNVLIHIGMNTVRLDGEGFKAFVKQGDTVKKGDKLLEVDINSIHEKGYSLETPVLVTNADDYADVIEMASGSVKAGAPLLTALK